MLSIGVRGGGQTFLSSSSVASTELKGGFGGGGTLDLRYTFYGCLTDRMGIGFTAGAGFGFGTTALNGTHTDHYTNTDYLGNRMDYETSATFKQKEQFGKADISLLLAFCFGNVTLNIGPRMMLPFASSSLLTLTETTIDAYYPQYNVHIVNEPITGYRATPHTLPFAPAIPKYNLLMAAEIGYEWYIQNQHCLGLQIYADIGVWHSPLPVTDNPLPIISVAPITDSDTPAPAVTINDPSYLVSHRRFLDFGLRAYYAFAFGRSAKDNHSRARDTKNHRNRYFYY